MGEYEIDLPQLFNEQLIKILAFKHLPPTTIMRKKIFVKLAVCFSILFLLASAALAQKRRPVKAKTKAKPIIFAVINDGQAIEPLAFIDKGALVQTVGGDDEAEILADFVKTYYQPKMTYRLIFGGADAGTVTVKSSDAKAECSKNMAQVTAQSAKAKLKGFVMALATNEPPKKTASGLRRLPTPTERAEIESLVRAEFAKQNISDKILRNLKYHNLTALDVDNNKKAEMVGSFWVETAPTERGLLFFIADKAANGKYTFGYSEFKTVKRDDVMSGDIKNVDEGMYHERLLDALEYDGDTTAEIFTYVQSFEGSSFNAYSRQGGKWTKAFEGSNYHCAY